MTLRHVSSAGDSGLAAEAEDVQRERDELHAGGTRTGDKAPRPRLQNHVQRRLQAGHRYVASCLSPQSSLF